MTDLLGQAFYRSSAFSESDRFAYVAGPHLNV